MKTLPLSVLALLLLSCPAFAHHSTAEYDRSVLRELEGELVEVHWRNPHVTFKLRAVNEAGGVEDWELSSLAIALLANAGLAESMFTVGARVKAAGWQSRRRTSMLVNNLLLPNGEEALFSPDSRLRWSDKPMGGRWARESVSGDARGLYRIWSVADLGAYLKAARAVTFQLTPEAQAKMGSKPPTLDTCKPQGMPGIMLNPLPVGFVDRGDHIEMQLATFGVLRTIQMTDQRNPTTVPLSDLGYSTGRWEGDTLEVRTTRIGWPYVDDDGRPQSENVEVLERLSLLNDGALLRYTQTVTDLVSLVEPVTVTWDLFDAGDAAIEPVKCE
jgi:hypothetical protein